MIEDWLMCDLRESDAGEIVARVHATLTDVEAEYVRDKLDTSEANKEAPNPS